MTQVTFYTMQRIVFCGINQSFSRLYKDVWNTKILFLISLIKIHLGVLCYDQRPSLPKLCKSLLILILFYFFVQEFNKTCRALTFTTNRFIVSKPKQIDFFLKILIFPWSREVVFREAHLIFLHFDLSCLGLSSRIWVFYLFYNKYQKRTLFLPCDFYHAV